MNKEEFKVIAENNAINAAAAKDQAISDMIEAGIETEILTDK